jgi:hypothetical protein
MIKQWLTLINKLQYRKHHSKCEPKLSPARAKVAVEGLTEEECGGTQNWRTALSNKGWNFTKLCGI